MAHIIHCHPTQTAYEYHIYTDLDFWDARVLEGACGSKRNFGQEHWKLPGGRRSPRSVRRKSAFESHYFTPRHVIVRSILRRLFQFDPSVHYPARWSPSRMMYFTHNRLPLDQPSLNSAFKTICLSWIDKRIRVEQIQRTDKYDPVIASKKEAKRRQRVPGCF
jgi:hypothetical protein